MQKLTLTDLVAACTAGGATVLTSTTELAPAGGPLAGVAPARYLAGNTPTYVYETRPLDGEPVSTVLIDSKASSINRLEDQLSMAIADGHPVLSRTPRLVVDYGEHGVFADYDLPHRAFDGHLQAGTIEGQPTTQHPAYRALRDANATNARALLESAPTCLVLGGWDSKRQTNQSRFRSALTGEIIGVLADQSPTAPRNPKRGGSRIDPVAAGVHLSASDADALLATQEDTLSPKLIESIKRDGKGKSAVVSGSRFGLGNIPPALDGLGQVACSRIIRSFTLSFAALRQLRFGSTPEGNAACRALLAAWAINGMVRAQGELLIRANCDLVEAAEPETWIDARYGKKVRLAPLSVEEADRLLLEAIEHAEAAAGIHWQGQVLLVTGNPIIIQAASEDADE